MSFFENNIRRVVPYTPGEQPVGKVIKLNTNESPYPPAPMVDEVLNSMDYDKFRLYPDPDISKLSAAIADYYKVSKENVFVGVGSDDVLAMSFLTFFNSDKPIVFPDITYSFYKVWADLYRIPYKTFPLDSNWNIVEADYIAPNGGVVLANPNAPTGVSAPYDVIERIISANKDVVVIIDEAYVDFGGETVLNLIDKYDNLLVVRTFSKSRAMAGMRIGYAFGSIKLIKALNDVKFSYNSYTLNTPSIEMGVASINSKDYFEQTVSKIIKTRENTKEKLKSLGFYMTETKTNFIFATHEKYKAKDIFEYLKSKKIYVRYFNLDRIDNYLRISIGTDEEMEELYKNLQKYMEE